MPQLDFLTFYIQSAFIFWLVWSLALSLIFLILPQYLIFDNSKKFLWQAVKSLLFFTKLKVFYNFLDIISNYNKLYFVLFKYLTSTKYNLKMNIYFQNNVLCNLFLNKFLRISKFLNLSLNSYNYEKKHKLTFLLIKKSIYVFSHNYKNLEINLKTFYDDYFVCETLRFRLLEDEMNNSCHINDLDKMVKKYPEKNTLTCKFVYPQRRKEFKISVWCQLSNFYDRCWNQHKDSMGIIYDMRTGPAKIDYKSIYLILQDHLKKSLKLKKEKMKKRIIFLKRLELNPKFFLFSYKSKSEFIKKEGFSYNIISNPTEEKFFKYLIYLVFFDCIIYNLEYDWKYLEFLLKHYNLYKKEKEIFFSYKKFLENYLYIRELKRKLIILKRRNKLSS